MPSHTQLLLDTRNHLQESEACAAYSADVAAYYRQRDAAWKWLVAAAACAPLIARLAHAGEGAAAWPLALIPLLAIALPLLGYAGKIELAASLHGKCAELIPQLKELWHELCAEEAPSAETLEVWHKRATELDRRLADLKALQADMPEIQSLAGQGGAAAEYSLPHFVDESAVEAGPVGGATLISWGVAEHVGKADS